MWMMRGPLSEPGKRRTCPVLHTRRQPHEGGSDGYASSCGMHAWPSRCSWPRGTTTQPHGDRSRPGAGRRYELHVTAKFQNYLLPNRTSSSCTRKSAGGSRPPCLGEPQGPQGRVQQRTSSSPTSYPWCWFCTFLCRRWATSWWLRSSTSMSRFPSRLSKCPRSRRHPVVLACVDLAWCSWSRRRRSSWWRCRLPCLFPLCSRLPSRSLTFQFLALVVIVEVFKVFLKDKRFVAAYCRADRRHSCWWWSSRFSPRPWVVSLIRSLA